MTSFKIFILTFSLSPSVQGVPKQYTLSFVWCYQPEFQVQVDNNNLVKMWEELVVERSDEEQVEVSVT